MSSYSRKAVPKASWRVPLLCSTCLVLTLLAFALPASPRLRQQGNRQTPTFAVEAAMVVVDLSVRDRKGNLVGDLKREDFKVYEDNVPQEIVTFSAETVAIEPALASDSPAREASQTELPSAPVINLSLNPDQPVHKIDLSGKRLLILFFDLSSLGTEDLIRSVDTACDFVSKQTGPQDLMAIATYSSTLELIQDLTNDRALLFKTLRSLASVDSGDAAVEVLDDEESSDEIFVPDNVQFDIFNTDRRLSALATLARMYREFTMRKSVIYFTSGITTTGIENNYQIRATVDEANRSNMSFYTVDSRGLVALPPGGNASQRSAGGRAMFSGAAMMRQRTNLFSSQETLTTIAHDTGGRAFTDSNDLSLALEQAQQDTHIYYVLGYFSSNSKQDGKYRRIRIEVSRPDLKVEHRPGYFAAKAFSQLNQQERDFQLQQALAVDRPFSDVPVILQADCFRSDNNTAVVPISIELDGDGLKFEDKGANSEGKFEFIAQITDSKGKITGVARDAVSVRLPAEKAEKIRAGGIFYSTGFQLRPGDYRLKFLVRDNATGKMGGFEQPVSVPSMDLKQLSTSSIVLASQLPNLINDSDSVISHQGTMRRFQAMAAGYDPLATGNMKIVPSIGNVFLARQTVYVYFHVYGAAEDHESRQPAIETDLMLIKDNTKILETQPRYIHQWTRARGGPLFNGARGPGGPFPGGEPGRGGRGMGGNFGRMGGPPGMPDAGERKGEATVAISLPLKNLKKGTYTLQVHVRDTIADMDLFQRVPVVIQ